MFNEPIDLEGLNLGNNSDELQLVNDAEVEVLQQEVTEEESTEATEATEETESTEPRSSEERVLTCPPEGLCKRSLNCPECTTKRYFRAQRREQRRCERYYIGLEVTRMTHEGIPESEPPRLPKCQFDAYLMRYYGRRDAWMRSKALVLQKRLDRLWNEFEEKMKCEDPDFDLHYRRERRPTGYRGLAPRLPEDEDLDEGIFEWDDTYNPAEDEEDSEDDEEPEPQPRRDDDDYNLVFEIDL